MVLNGCMINKDVLHHKMPRLIVNPRVLLLDCALEYKKGESNTNIEITNEEVLHAFNCCCSLLALEVECCSVQDFAALLEIEEAYIKEM